MRKIVSNQTKKKEFQT